MTTTTAIPSDCEAEVELARFFELVGQAARSGADPCLPMFSSAVDACWHDMANNEPAGLDQFCREHAGIPLRHVAATGTGPIEWVPDYEARFGPLPIIWFTRRDGSVDTRALEAYQATGTVVTDWDCSPMPTDPDREGGIEAPPAPTHTAPRPQEQPLPGVGE